LDDAKAQSVVARWSGGGGVVPRGPTQLLSVVPATPADIERHTGHRTSAFDLWRLEVSGRFLASSGLVYPGGVPYPEDLHNEMPIVANEVWLYADDDGTIVGTYWWPDAVRKPIASVARGEYPSDSVVALDLYGGPPDLSDRLDVRLPLPKLEPWKPAVAVCASRREVRVFCATDAAPDEIAPDLLNEMLVYEHGGISVHAETEEERPDWNRYLRSHQPPYRKMAVRLTSGVGRDPGRSLGPQTWPWPGELRWWEKGVDYEVKGFVQLATLVEIAESI
jgi:hypothetical protein